MLQIFALGRNFSIWKYTNMVDCTMQFIGKETRGYVPGDTFSPKHPAVVTKYQKRISGPLLDRIDIHMAEALQNRPKLVMG